MHSISRILVPVDFSEQSLALLQTVRTIATKYGSEVILLHVVSPFYTIPPTGVSGPVLIPVSPEQIATHEDRLQHFAASELEGLPVRRIVYEGEAVSQIVSFARAEGIQLIAIPTHGGALRRFLLGSVTSKILHDTDCPVLTGIHMQEKPAPRPKPFSNILCAVDLGPQSRQVLSWAAQTAADFGAKLHLLHVVAALDRGLPMDFSPTFQLDLESLVRKDVEALQIAAGAESATVHIGGGDLAKAVRSQAEAIRADLLVIGRGPLDGAAGRLPTNAYAIIRQSSCPVLSL
jgi:nucleotide-binding universal stress UspA family protein